MKRLITLLSLASLVLGFALAQAPQDTYVYQSFGSPDTMDPAQSYDTASSHIIENVYEGLYGYEGDKADAYAPLLATGYTVSPDNLTYTFTLREGVTFHSGNPFTCADAAYSFKRALVTNPADSGAWILAEPLLGTGANANDDLGEGATDAQYAEYFQKIDNAVECTDDRTFVVHTVTPDPAFFAKILFPAANVIDSQWAMDNGEWDGTEATWRDWVGVDLREHYLQDHMSGTGAYQFVEWVPGQRVVTRAFADYWGGAPALQNVLIQTVDDQNASILALKNGDADRIVLGELSAMSQIDGLPGVKIYNKDGDLGWSSVNVTAGFMNQDVQGADNTNIGSGQLDGNGIPADFFSDVHMRKCVNYSFDRQAFIEQVLLGYGNTITMALPPSYLGYDESVPEYTLDLEKAEEECKLAWDGQVWENGFQFTIQYNTGNLQRQTVAEILKANLEFLNSKFKVDVRGVAWPDFLAQQRASALPLFISGWAPDYADPDNYIHTFYASTGYYAKYYGLHNANIDALDEQARTELDPEARTFLYSQIGRAAYDESLLVLVPVQRPMIWARDTLQGVYLNPMYGGQFLWKDISKN